MKKRVVFHLLSGIIALISVFMLTCSDSNPASGGSEDKGGGNQSGCTKPAAPADVKAAALSMSAIQVTWNAVSGVDLYVVYRSLTPDGTYSNVGKVIDAAFKDSALTPATAYYYKVAAKNDCGEGARSTLATATTMSCTKPATPTNVKAEALSAVSIKVSWDSIPTAAYYEIYHGTSADGEYNSIDTTTNRTYTHTRLQTSSTHYYKIVTKNVCGESEKSGYANATTNACPKPAAPANVNAEAKSSSSILVTWDEVATALTYKIYRSGESAGTYLPVGNTSGKSSTSWTDEGLELATTYYYKVVAESECEESAKSNYGFAATANCENKPAAPTNVIAEALSPTEVKISWNAVDGAKTYNIYTKQGDLTDGYYLVWEKLTKTTVTISGRHPSTTYYFRISAENDCGESEKSLPEVSAVTQDCNLPVLPDPTGVTATALSAKSVVINWNEVSGAASYTIYRSTKEDSDYWSVSGGTGFKGTSFIDTTLSASTKYYYAIKPVNDCGKSSYISSVTIVTTMCETSIPLNVTATAKSSGSIEVSWDAVSGAVSYSIYRATRNPTNQYTLIGKISGTSSTYTDTGLENLTSYYYKITAKTATCDDSRQSTYAAGTTQ